MILTALIVGVIGSFINRFFEKKPQFLKFFLVCLSLASIFYSIYANLATTFFVASAIGVVLSFYSKNSKEPFINGVKEIPKSLLIVWSFFSPILITYRFILIVLTGYVDGVK